jgi:hypothetical protein
MGEFSWLEGGGSQGEIDFCWLFYRFVLVVAAGLGPHAPLPDVRHAKWATVNAVFAVRAYSESFLGPRFQS